MAILGANTRRQGKVVKAGEGLQEVLISVDGRLVGVRLLAV